MEVNLEKLISESTTLIDLVPKLEEKGVSFSNSREVVDYFEHERSILYKEKIDEVIVAPPSSEDLPTLLVQNESTSFYFHGIGHGWPILLAPGWHLRKPIRERISEEMAAFDNPQSGIDYLFESGMDYKFDLDSKKNLPEPPVKYNLNILNLAKTAFFVTFGLVLVPPLFGLGAILASCFGKTKIYAAAELHYMYKSMSDMGFQNKLKDFWGAKSFPQPLEVELKYVDGKNSIMKKFGYAVAAFTENYPTAPERSLHWTEYIHEIAQKQKLRELHVLNGLSHAYDLTFFAENPGFSFEPVEHLRVELNSRKK